MTGGFWQWLEARADRKDARKLLIIDKGLDARSLFRAGVTGSDPRFLIALTIILLFAWAFARESDSDTRKLMIGALIAAFAGAWGFYLGSSNSATRANDRADKALEMGQTALKQLPPPPVADVTLEPGDTARVAAEPAASLAEEG